MADSASPDAPQPDAPQPDAPQPDAPQPDAGAAAAAAAAADPAQQPELPATMQAIVLRRRPEGLLTWDDVELVTQPLPTLAEGEALMQVIYLSMDATVRTWLNRGEGYLPAVEVGEVVRCSGIGHVVATNCDAYEVGDLVYSLPGWATYGVVRDDLFTTKLDPDTPLRPMMSVFGGTGAAAYFGLLDIGKPQPGETVVVSAAGGATGSLVGLMQPSKPSSSVTQAHLSSLPAMPTTRQPTILAI